MFIQGNKTSSSEHVLRKFQRSSSESDVHHLRMGIPCEANKNHSEVTFALLFSIFRVLVQGASVGE